jgi:hypothetical protein
LNLALLLGKDSGVVGKVVGTRSEVGAGTETSRAGDRRGSDEGEKGSLSEAHLWK